MKRKVVTACGLALAAAVTVAASVFAFAQQRSAEQLKAELGRANATLGERTKALSETSATLSEFSQKLARYRDAEASAQLSVYRSAAYAYLVANRESLSDIADHGAFIAIDALKATRLIPTSFDGKIGQRNVCLWLTRTHENQWALLTFTSHPAYQFLERELTAIRAELGSGTHWFSGPDMALDVDGIRLDLAAAAVGDGCLARAGHPVNIMLVDLRHPDLRL